MKLFLTSKIGATIYKNGLRVPGNIDNSCGFLTHFSTCLKSTTRMLYISSTPEHNEKVSDWFYNTIAALNKADICFDESILVNGQNASCLEDMIPKSDVIFLSGGHLPTQNKFFQDIGLDKLLADYSGIIVAQSAGSMNCAKTVYVCPEIPGESIDPGFVRFRPGLGLTDINIIPHYNDNRNLILDGKRFYEEVIYPDTFQIPLYILPDGPYFYVHNQEIKLYGEAYLFERGEWKQISSFTP